MRREITYYGKQYIPIYKLKNDFSGFFIYERLTHASLRFIESLEVCK